MKTILTAMAIAFATAAGAAESGDSFDELLGKADSHAQCVKSGKPCEAEKLLGVRQLVKPAEPRLQINFGNGSAQLSERSLSYLDKLATAMNRPKYQDWSFEVSGHTDATGPRPVNIKLSEDRARAVVEYLTAKGVEPRRLRAKGYGPDRLLDKDRPDSAQNRRVIIDRLI